MNTEQNIEARLWDYIDGLSDAQEKSVIEELISRNAEWRSKYRELLDVQQLLQSSELEEPSMRFTKNVMDEISKLHISPATKSYINKNIIRGLAIFFVSMIIGFLIYGFGQVDFSTPSDKELPVDLGNLDYSLFFNNTYINAFMMLNIILGLFLLDHYLSGKKKKWREGV